MHWKTGAVVAVVGLSLVCAGRASATSSSVPPESWGRRLTPADAPAQPVALPPATVTRRSLSSQATGLIAFVNVRVDLVHPRPADLELSLLSPTGTRVVLARGASSLSGTYGDGLSPLEALEQLEGEEPWGTWELEVTDRQGGAPGVLRSWGLELQLQSRAVLTASTLRIPYERAAFPAGQRRRRVFYQVPLGTPPASGWPVALLFQGSLAPAQLFFHARTWYPKGAWHQVRTVKLLLDSGYAVVAPEAIFYGTAWQTSFAPFADDFARSSDHALMLRLFDELIQGRFGYVDTTRYYAGGISSGGYMTSRMAVSYPGRFRALAIHGGAYATNFGPLASLPPRMPALHPPTLFLHGERDRTVPIRTMEAYRDALQREGYAVRTVLDPDVGHAWIPRAPEEILAWFERN